MTENEQMVKELWDKKYGSTEIPSWFYDICRHYTNVWKTLQIKEISLYDYLDSKV